MRILRISGMFISSNACPSYGSFVCGYGYGCGYCNGLMQTVKIAWAAGVGATSARSARPPARRSSRPHAASASRCCPGKAAAVVYRSARLTSRKRAREAHQDLRTVKSDRVSEARDTKCNDVNQLQLNTNTTNNRNFGKYLPKFKSDAQMVRAPTPPSPRVTERTATGCGPVKLFSGRFCPDKLRTFKFGIQV